MYSERGLMPFGRRALETLPLSTSTYVRPRSHNKVLAGDFCHSTLHHRPIVLDPGDSRSGFPDHLLIHGVSAGGRRVYTAGTAGDTNCPGELAP